MDIGIVENWLQDAALPPEVPRVFDKDGYWSVSVSGAELTIGINREDESLYFYVPLFALDGTENVAFYRRLLQLQGMAALPPGMMFGVEKDPDTLVLTGRYPVRLLDGAMFERLLSGCFKVMSFLIREMRNFVRNENRDKEIGAPHFVLSEAASLSDEELIRSQMDRSIRF